MKFFQQILCSLIVCASCLASLPHAASAAPAIGKNLGCKGSYVNYYVANNMVLVP